MEIASLRHLCIDLIKWFIQAKIYLKILTRWFLLCIPFHYFSGTVSHNFYFILAILFIFIIWILILSLIIIAKHFNNCKKNLKQLTPYLNFRDCMLTYLDSPIVKFVKQPVGSSIEGQRLFFECQVDIYPEDFTWT